MAGAAGEAPNEPPPDYEYAINHPEDTVTMTPPDYRAAANLPSYQEAMLDKGNHYDIKYFWFILNVGNFLEKLLAEDEEDEIDTILPPHPTRRISSVEWVNENKIGQLIVMK